MIRRAIIFTAAITVLAAGVCFLSYVWQFGYVGSWFTVGMREGQLWYVWRSAPILDAVGSYSDEASAVNRAMYHINANARFNEEPVWDWVIGFAAFSAYVLVLLAAARISRFRAPRWATISLASITLLSALSWFGSQLRTFRYDGQSVVFSISDGTLSLYASYSDLSSTIGPLTLVPGMTRNGGWVLDTAPPLLRMNYGDWFSITPGLILINLPIAIVVLLFFPPTLICAYSRRGKPGHCRRCDYNLTGNVSGVCPECGQRCAVET